MADASSRRVHRRRCKFFEDLGEGLIAFAGVVLDERRAKKEAPPEIPPEALYLWQWFLELHVRRDSGFGPERLKSREIEAWARISQINLKLWELGLILRLDDIWMAGQIAKANKKTSGPSEPAGELRDEASIDDPKSMMRVLRGLAMRSGKSKKKH